MSARHRFFSRPSAASKEGDAAARSRARSHVRARRWSAGLGAVALLACTGAPPRAPAPAPAPLEVAGSLDEACAAFGRNECAVLVRCASFDLLRDYGTESLCEARKALACVSRARLEGIADGRFAQSMLQCATIAPSCDAFRLGLRDASCTPSGTLTEEASCRDDAQCGEGLGCSRWGAGDGPCGVCRKLAEPGESCSEYACSAPLLCRMKIGVCAAPQLEGSGCMDDWSCPPTMWCADACRARGREGAPCVAHRACDEGFLCGSDARCVAVRVIGEGAACDPNDQADMPSWICAASGTCAKDGRCAPAASDGASCANAACMPPATCDEQSAQCVVHEGARCP